MTGEQKYVRENRKELIDSINHRFLPFNGEEIDRLLKIYDSIKEEKFEIDSLRHRRNEIEKLKGNDETKNQEAKKLRDQITKKEEGLVEMEADAENIFLKLPNVIDPSVPIARDDGGNLEISRWGEARERDFKVIRGEELAISKGMLDLESAAKMAGSRFLFLKGKLVQLAIALELYSINKMVEKGYTAVIPPLLMKEQTYRGIAHMATFEDALYQVTGKEDEGEERRLLISTTEHPLIAMYQGSVLEEKDLPIKLIGESTAFRKEAGAHGKDTKGMFRLHQFDQTEMIAICRPNESAKMQDEFLRNEEEMLRELELPYRLVMLSSGDMGVRDFKQLDLEVFMPYQSKYREVMSNDNCTDWISRRSGIRFADAEGNKIFAHTVDATGLAIQRTIKSILEVHQRKDGTVRVPEPLVKFTGFSTL